MVSSQLLIASACIFIVFLLSLILTKFWIRTAHAAKLTGKDMNKVEKKEVAEAGGVSVILSIVVGLLIYVAIKKFYIQTDTHLIETLAIVSTLLLASFIGFIDDILGWKKGLKQWQKPLLTIPLAIPLIVIGAGNPTITLLFIGSVNFGLIYTFIIIPLALVGASNGFNMLAGLNGLEASMGAIIFSAMGLISILNNNMWIALVCFLSVAALIGFLIFNKYPSKVFPGDSLTYSIGALVAVIAILGNMEIAALILFTPYLIELIIKAKNKFKSECFGAAQADGTLKAPDKIGSLTHIFMRIFKTESKTVAAILALELIIAVIVILI